MSRRCDAIGCTAEVAHGRFMCITHWRLVPVDLQRTINTRFRVCRKDFGFLRDVAYLDAAVQAIDGIAKREGRSAASQPHPANPYRRHLVLARRAADGREAAT